MNRLDFHSVAILLQKHLIETADMTQIVFISTLFSCFVNDSDFSFDEGLCCKWMKGQAKISPKIVSYYQIPKHQEEMYADMEEEVFLMISDVGALITDLHDLLISDVSVSELKRRQLLSHFNDNDTFKAAIFASEILLFAISRPFVKANLKANDISPAVEDIIITATVPKPVKTYIDRPESIAAIDALLEEHNTLFLYGIPGIGKSELIKVYCKAHKKDYTNILFLEYTGSLYEMIADMEFVDDSDTLTEKERFRRHFRFLKTLKNDSLIVIDNFNPATAQENLLSQVCSLKCKTVFTTHNNFTGYPLYEVTAEFSVAKELFKMHCTDQCLYTDDEIHLLLESVHYHTMTVELLARLLSYGTITTQNLLTKLKENVLFKEDISNITLNKDNQNRKLAYHKHIESLLDLQQLEPDTLIVLSVIALAPDSGFPIKLFYDWHGAYINELQILEERGLLVKDHQRLLLNPYLRKIINARKMLSLSQAPDFFATLLQMVSDSNHEHIQFALDILNTTLLFVNKNERITWKKLVSHGLEISSQLHHYRLFQKLLGEYEGICYLYQNITNEDSATLLHYKATEASMIHQNQVNALELEEKAIAEACEKGTTRIFNLSSIYLDAGSYCMKLHKSEQALNYIQKSANVLIQTQMQFSPNGLYTMTTYAKLLYQQGKFPEAARIFTNCIGITDKVYESDALTKGYLLQNLAAVHASMRNAKVALMYYAQAESIFHKFLDKEHPDLLICKNQRENVIGMDGQKVDLLEIENL